MILTGSKIAFVFDLLEPDPIISKRILRHMAIELNARARRELPHLDTDIRRWTLYFYRNSFIYESLTSGKLAGHLGLPIRTRHHMVDKVIQTVVANLRVEWITAYGTATGFTGASFVIRILKKDFSDVLSLPEAKVVTPKYTLNWLEWMLLRGDSIIVTEHRFDPIAGRGRSLKGVMISDTSSSWRIPTWGAGTLTSNWLIKPIISSRGPYMNGVKTYLQDALIRMFA